MISPDSVSGKARVAISIAVLAFASSGCDFSIAPLNGSIRYDSSADSPSLESASITNASPTNNLVFGLSYGSVTGDYSSYCILENDTEVEALLAENRLIKDIQPRFNARLLDDKTFPYLMVTTDEEFPGVYVTREPRKGAKL